MRYRYFLVLLSVTILFCAGCGNKITRANFDKILKEKMTEQDVSDLLGSGKISTRAGVPSDMKEMVWEKGANSILIQFKDGKANGGSIKLEGK